MQECAAALPASTSSPEVTGDWSEAAAGTNALGTAIADGHVVQLLGAEHYCSGWQDLPVLRSRSAIHCRARSWESWMSQATTVLSVHFSLVFCQAAIDG